ncbi:MAG: hypothetical protein K0Q66_2480 [Chitinophagaceae bacterium]|jgi:hypothetical protein|nr:hypothetical protein [Chitinophagaceae bacterium]
MKIISTKVHGVLDYLMGVMLIASPWIFGFAFNGAQLWIPVLLGITMIVYSLMTEYELGLSDNISMRTHLVMDFISGAILAASPWLFGFADQVYLPHLLLGLAEIGAAALTTTVVGQQAMGMKLPTTEQPRLRSRTRTAHG